VESREQKRGKVRRQERSDVRAILVNIILRDASRNFMSAVFEFIEHWNLPELILEQALLKRLGEVVGLLDQSLSRDVVSHVLCAGRQQIYGNGPGWAVDHVI
jgi:hypothetical protein